MIAIEFTLSLLLAAPPRYYFLHNSNVALLFGISLTTGIGAGMIARRTKQPKLQGLTVLFASVVLFAILQLYSIAILQHEEFLPLAMERDLFGYLVLNTVMLFTVTAGLTWLVC